MRQAGTTRRYEVNRDGPDDSAGSKIFIQVTDFCRDLPTGRTRSKWI